MMLWYVLHGTTVFMDLRCQWYSGIVFIICYVAIRITWHHRIHELRMRMIRWHRTVFQIWYIFSPWIRWYHVIRITTYHILNTMPLYHMHALSMNTVLPCNTYHNKSSVNKMILKIINVKQYRRGSKKDIPDKLYQHRL
jgi:hypothetical protein